LPIFSEVEAAAPLWTSRPRLLRRAWQVALVLALVALAAHDVVGLGRPRGNVVFDRWLYEGIELAAAVGCLMRAARVRTERGAWLAIGLALLSTTLGDVVFDFAYGGNPPFPSAADAFYLAFYPACYIGIGLLLRARLSRFSASLWLDGLMAGLAAAALGASLLLHVVVASTQGSPLVVATNLAYPLGDLVLLAMLVFVFAVTGWRPGRAWTLLAAGLLLLTVGDGLFLYQTATNSYVEGTYVDLCWPTSLALMAFAAWHSAAPSRQRGGLEQRTLIGTPVVCGLIGVGVLVAATQAAIHPVAVALAAATVVLVLGRTALTFRENVALLARSRTESLTDALTGLGNRRKLIADLGSLLDEPHVYGSRLLVIFDLNGFKDYNDSFGHPAGDALLARLGGKLSAAVRPEGSAYRMGGDEFCVLMPASETLLDRAALALCEQGETFTVSSAFGGVLLPDEARDASTALVIADERLYAHKEQQPTRRGRAHELLLRTLAEREPGLREHVAGVASLAVAVARRLGIAGNDLDELRLAGELHDIGKLAIPDAVLQKSTPLDDQEWSFVRQHTLIGQRILAPAAALTGVGRIVRSTHENWDGRGYPDGLAGEEIPLAARVIAACDAFVTIRSDRPYRAARTEADAIAGTQFQPGIVDVLCAVIADGLPDEPESASVTAA
jgi:diguanylate cyclase (GGDEF)-like protein